MRFMIELGFVADQEAAIRALVPQEQAHIEQLRTQGLLEAFYMSSDYARVWLVMREESLAEVEQRLQAFPLYPYMTPQVMPLM